MPFCNCEPKCTAGHTRHCWWLACLLGWLVGCLLACLFACLPACIPACLPACLPACSFACLVAGLLACLLAKAYTWCHVVVAFQLNPCLFCIHPLPPPGTVANCRDVALLRRPATRASTGPKVQNLESRRPQMHLATSGLCLGRPGAFWKFVGTVCCALLH